MLLAGCADAPLTGGLDGPIGSRRPVADGFVELAGEPLARAMVLDDTYQQVALVAVDLLAVDDEVLAAAREVIWETVRIRSAQVIVVPTGVMTAPLAVTRPGGPPPSEVYRELVAAQIASAVIFAARARRAAAAGWHHGEATLGRFGDTPLRGPRVFAVDAVDGPPIGLVAELPALPDGGGRVLDTDYPGAFRRRLDPHGTVGLGLLGPAAGVDPLCAEPAPLGEQLAGLAWAGAAATPAESTLRLGVASAKVELPLATVDAEAAAARLERAEARLEAAGDPLYRRAAEVEAALAERALALVEQAVGSITVDLTAVAVAGGAWLASPLVIAPPAAELVGWPRVSVLSAGARAVLTTPEFRLPTLEGWYSPVALGDQAAAIWAEAGREVLKEAAERGSIDGAATGGTRGAGRA